MTTENIPDWELNGIVKSIQPEEGTITLWLEDFAELQTVQVDPSMPEWMKRPRVAFQTSIPQPYVTQGYINNTITWRTFQRRSVGRPRIHTQPQHKKPASGKGRTRTDKQHRTVKKFLLDPDVLAQIERLPGGTQSDEVNRRLRESFQRDHLIID